MARAVRRRRGTTIDVTHRGLMAGYDINDPEQDPITASARARRRADGASAGGDFKWGTAYNGHFDQTGVVRGEVCVCGHRIPIDCVATMDHSWGPRPERGIPEMSWLHAHFSADYAIHAIFSFDSATGGTEYDLAHGYVLQDGQVYGLRAGRGTTKRDGNRFPHEVTASFTDVRGVLHELHGEAVGGYPWLFWLNMVGFTFFVRFTGNGGVVGYGEAMDLCELPTLTAPRELRHLHRSAAGAQN